MQIPYGFIYLIVVTISYIADNACNQFIDTILNTKYAIPATNYRGLFYGQNFAKPTIAWIGNYIHIKH